MPLYKELKLKEINIYIWKITETESFFRDRISLSSNCLKQLNLRKKSNHRLAFLSVRKILTDIGYASNQLNYNEYGAPFLIDKNFISITHSFNYSAIIIGKKPVGIDIEKQQKRIIKLNPKFLNEKENFYKKSKKPITTLTKVWTAKEALFKIYQKKLNFKAITIQSFSTKQNKTTAIVNYEKKEQKHTLYFLNFKEFCGAYTY